VSALELPLLWEQLRYYVIAEALIRPDYEFSGHDCAVENIPRHVTWYSNISLWGVSSQWRWYEC